MLSEAHRYFHGNLKIIPTSASPDLIVANRVPQHILDDGEFRETVRYLTSIARYFYVNEVGVEEATSFGDPFMKGGEYSIIFRDLGWRVVDRGELTDQDGMRQSWILFAQ